ncbi:diaminopimelate epimerase [Candidatus Cytomitobacter indipagum]|uniref:Diaminopimelate epimerase n=1 Tax=Candidatus Cytomitobacter indipagum TaxID=2601575 RepID=A0A5C0UEG0_9PROT|nr:diaminopimelate epimerase [Candidatus Cytomitobacter indipagum]QEK38149.1 diaminopimelate epimerase [Candidatus Cytomitobacter indipagum]
MKFIKAHGLGNDFVMIFEEINHKQILKISDRKLGIGCDQLIQNIQKNGKNYVRFWNQDGSEANLCGNGIRCLAKYYTNTRNKFITKSGTINTVKLENQIAFSLPIKPIINSINHNNIYDVNIGNEHIVIIENKAPNWNEITLQFANYLQDKNIMCIWNDGKWNIQSWERGVGRTLACGSGTIAAACAGWHSGQISQKQVKFYTEIGELCIVQKTKLWQIGEANIVAEGDWTN